ncbi:MAG: tRNA preQ1(34) S-adenosylmethionine ribosyltransferase-isomerase QueA [Dehalococcoidales bacterium]|nr:tRNA preQ1(34) S-adenosylmethionine ribosyltransferase-isomerase QueA [Dehalococcoidales bacterium]
MKTSDFDYFLPQEMIAQTPLEPRDTSRLLVVNRSDSTITHVNAFSDICRYFRAGDVLVFNDSRVMPARLKGIKPETGGKVELLLLKHMQDGLWEALVKPGKRVRLGTKIELYNESLPPEEIIPPVFAEIADDKDEGIKLVRFSDEKYLPVLGKMPLPPYIHTPLGNPERYQTIYADINRTGSAAAPTAGLHFTPGLIDKLRNNGIKCLFTTLHVGLDTFRPVQGEDLSQHKMHCEYGCISREAADEVSRAKREGRRVICVGTTSVRLVEYAAGISKNASLDPFEGWVNLFILPGYKFLIPDAMITNFHLPKSTLLMLVSAFGGIELMKKAYQEAIEQNYRFYSFGDAMLII